MGAPVERGQEDLGDSIACLRDAWQSRRFVALASHDTVSEVIRVFMHLKFKLSRTNRRGR